jgi:hypothetical protein
MNTKDKVISGNVSTERALDLALETLESIQAVYPCETVGKRITAIKQTRSAPTVQEPAIKQGWDVDTLLNKPAAQRPVAEPHKWVHATEWRGLTDEERYELLDKAYNPESYAVLIEAKLKAKNFA